MNELQFLTIGSIACCFIITGIGYAIIKSFYVN